VDWLAAALVFAVGLLAGRGFLRLAMGRRRFLVLPVWQLALGVAASAGLMGGQIGSLG
jgi:uncharacterized membrane protein